MNRMRSAEGEVRKAERPRAAVLRSIKSASVAHHSPLTNNHSPITIHLSPLTTHPSARRAISLIEVLISMFVLLFGLMGVAAIFPVGNFYVLEGEKFDLGAGIAQNAFEEMRARGMLRPNAWYYPTYANPTGPNPPVLGDPVIDLTNNTFLLPIPPQPPPVSTTPGPGHAFVLDPMGSADTSITPAERGYFPWNASVESNRISGANNPWGAILPGNQWPVRRVSLPIPSGTMTKSVAETIFRLRDDLAVEQPDESDRPSIQRWDVDDNGTLDIPADDILLRRQYKGDYSWLATIVPTTAEGLAALQPGSSDYGEIDYDVSVVVFRKRDDTPSATSERLIAAELLLGGELVIYSTTPSAKQDVDAAVEDIRPGNWISLMGVNQTTGDFVMKWFRILSMDDETDLNLPLTSTGGVVAGRRLMLIGPDWPAVPDPGNPGFPLSYIPDLRAGFFPGAISVVTKPLKMENSSMWDMQDVEIPKPAGGGGGGVGF